MESSMHTTANATTLTCTDDAYLQLLLDFSHSCVYVLAGNRSDNWFDEVPGGRQELADSNFRREVLVVSTRRTRVTRCNESAMLRSCV